MSSTEAEYVALPEACRVILWFRRVHEKLGMRQESTQISQDTVKTIQLEEGSTGQYISRRKHIDLRYHFVPELVEKERYSINKVGTDEMRGISKPNHWDPRVFALP